VILLIKNGRVIGLLSISFELLKVSGEDDGCLIRLESGIGLNGEGGCVEVMEPGGSLKVS
jgi:hypothetical protein